VANRRFYSRPSTVTTKYGRGDTITWTCPKGPFALHFGERTPFARVQIQSGLVGTTHTTSELVLTDAARGAYKHITAVYDTEIARVLIDASPDIIIEDWPETG